MRFEIIRNTNYDFQKKQKTGIQRFYKQNIPQYIKTKQNLQITFKNRSELFFSDNTRYTIVRRKYNCVHIVCSNKNFNKYSNFQTKYLKHKKSISSQISHNLVTQFIASGVTSEDFPKSFNPLGNTDPLSFHSKAKSPNVRGSLWALVRGNTLSPSANGAYQLGGAQAGVRLFVPAITVADKFVAGLSVRASMPLSGRGKELAMGISLAGNDKLPLPFEIIGERRFRVGEEKADKWALVLTSGLSDAPVNKSWKLNSYGQIGVVGTKNANFFAGGQVTIDRNILDSRLINLRAGVGIWGETQKGGSRLDIGPEIVLLPRQTEVPLRISVQWRQRISGHASPKSGPALVFASDF